jgi:hypothetical protein
MQVIAKDQGEAALNIHTGIACVADSKNGIHLFFYDNPKNDKPEPGEHRVKSVNPASKGNSMACVSVTAAGNMKKQFLYVTRENEFHLSPERSFSLKNNELVYLGIDIHVSIGEIAFFNNSKYHIGTITIQ